jgi:hypothetical protein
LGVVDVVQEQVDGADALLEAMFDRLPLVGAQQTRHHIERHDLFDALGALVERERDAARLERELGGVLPGRNLLRPQRH